MELQKQLGNTCLVTSVAMCLGASALELMEELEYTGDEVWWPDLKEPYCRRGHHIQEMRILCLRRGKMLMEFDPMPMLGHSQESAKNIFPDDVCKKLWEHYCVSGIILTQNHCVAFHHDTVYDPRGMTYPLTWEFIVNSREAHIIKDMFDLGI